MGKNINKNLKNVLENLLQMHLKLLQKEAFKKKQKQLVIFLIKLQKSQKNCNRIT